MAVYAAQGMLDTLEVLNQKYSPEIAIRIGLNWGDVILGDIGSPHHRLDYTMIGDAVNTTQRLESAADAQSCLLSDSLFRQIEDFVEVGAKRVLQVKNKKEPIVAYPLRKILQDRS